MLHFTRIIAVACLCALLIGSAFAENVNEYIYANSYNPYYDETELNVPLYSPEEAGLSGRIMWPMNRELSDYVTRLNLIHSVNLASGEVGSYYIDGYMVESDIDLPGATIAVNNDDGGTTLYQLSLDGALTYLAEIDEKYIAAYYGGNIFYYDYISIPLSNKPVISFFMKAADGSVYEYNFVSFDSYFGATPGTIEHWVESPRVGADGSIAGVKKYTFKLFSNYDPTWVYIENPNNGIIYVAPSGNFEPGMRIERCLGWYDENTILFGVKSAPDFGKEYLFSYKRDPTPYGREPNEKYGYFLNNDDEKIVIDELTDWYSYGITNVYSLNPSAKMLAYMRRTSYDGDKLSCFVPAVLDLETGKSYVLQRSEHNEFWVERTHNQLSIGWVNE